MKVRYLLTFTNPEGRSLPPVVVRLTDEVGAIFAEVEDVAKQTPLDVVTRGVHLVITTRQKEVELDDPPGWRCRVLEEEGTPPHIPVGYKPGPKGD